MNDIAAAKLWQGTSAIGKHICIYCTPENPRNWKRVVGVVTSVRHATIDEHRPFSLYLAAGAMEHAQFLVVKTAQPADSLEKAVRIAIAGVDPNQPVFLSVSMRSLIADSLADRRFIASLLAVTAVSRAGYVCRRCLRSCFVHHLAQNTGDRCSDGARRNSQPRSSPGISSRLPGCGGGPHHRIGSDHGADEPAAAGRSGAWRRALVADSIFGEHSVVVLQRSPAGFPHVARRR